MSQYHYGDGRIVRVSAASLSGAATADEFTILARHSVEGSEPVYVLRSSTGADQRVVPESELSRATGCPSSGQQIVH